MSIEVGQGSQVTVVAVGGVVVPESKDYEKSSEVEQGERGVLPVHVSLVSGLGASVDFELLNPPPGVLMSPASVSVFPPPGRNEADTTLNFDVAPDAPTGDYTLSISFSFNASHNPMSGLLEPAPNLHVGPECLDAVIGIPPPPPPED